MAVPMGTLHFGEPPQPEGRCSKDRCQNCIESRPLSREGGGLPSRSSFPLWVLCHEHHRSKRRCGTVREMKEGPSGSAIRSLIPSHRKLLWSNVTVVSVAETPGR